jgi:hypothetical protein
MEIAFTTNVEEAYRLDEDQVKSLFRKGFRSTMSEKSSEGAADRLETVDHVQETVLQSGCSRGSCDESSLVKNFRGGSRHYQTRLWQREICIKPSFPGKESQSRIMR